MPQIFRNGLGHLGYACNDPRFPKLEGRACEGCRNELDCENTPECELLRFSRALQEKFSHSFEIEVHARWAVAYANALLAELAKTED
jgi:hypothetical protein